MNRVILMGRITAAPELRFTQSNVPVVSFTVAVDREYRKDKEKEADFLPCVAWRSTAEFITKYFEKGKPILIEGRLQSRNYTNREGQKKTAYEVAVDKAGFVLSTLHKESELLEMQDRFEEMEGDLPF